MSSTSRAACSSPCTTLSLNAESFSERPSFACLANGDCAGVTIVRDLDAQHILRLSQLVDGEHACHKIDKRISISSSPHSHHAMIYVKDGHDMSTTVHDPQCRIRITLRQAMGCQFSKTFVPGPGRLLQTIEGTVQA
jgi:hypothetical protein